jgi:DHA2 family multidrug resistance protein
MIRNLTPSSRNYINQVNRLKPFFHGGANGGLGFGSGKNAGGIQSAQAFLYNQLHLQSAMLAYLDIIAILAIFCFLMIPLVLMIPHIAPPKGGPAMH